MSKRKRELERRYISTDGRPVELRAPGDGPTELHGYAAVFDQWTTIQDWYGGGWQESIAPGAFAKTIGEADIRALFNHDPGIVLGRNRAGTLDLVEDATGLRDVIRPPDNEWGRPVLDAVRRGDITGQSIGFRVIKEKWERPQTRGELAKRTILEARLFDVSVVTFPAFEMTSVATRAQDDDGDATAATAAPGVVGQAFQLVRLAEHGYPLAAEDRATITAAIAILRQIADASSAAGEPIAPDAKHSLAAADAEPLQLQHSAEARARRIRVLTIQMEAGL